MTPPVRSLVQFSAVAAVVGVLAFLLASGFLATWHGQVASVRSLPDGATTDVLIVGEEGRTWVQSWPTAAIEGRSLRVDPRSIPPAPLPEDLPTTHKSRFRLYFFVEQADGSNARFPTTSLRTVSVGALVTVLLVVLRNMVVAGSPMRIEPRPTELPHAQTPMGQTAPLKRKPPKKGPPPPRRRSGRR